MRATILFMCCVWVAVSSRAHADDKLRDEPSAEELAGKLCKLDQGRPTGEAKESLPHCMDAGCRELAQMFCEALKGKDDSEVKALDGGAKRGARVAVAAASWQTAFVTGLGNTVADRAKAEVEAWFEDLVRDQLCELKTKDVRWFPETCKLLGDKLGVGQQLATSMLAETMKRDMKQLVAIVAGYLESKLAHDKDAVAVLAIVPAVADLAHKFVTGRNPLVALRDVARSASLQKACQSRDPKTQMTPACALVFGGIAIDYYGAVLKDAMKAGGALDPVKARQLVVRVFAAGELKCEVFIAMSGKASCELAIAEPVPTAITTFFSVATITDEATVNKLFAVLQDMIDLNDLLKAPAPSSSEEIRARVRQVLEKVDVLVGHIEALVWAAPPQEVRALRLFLRASASIANQEYAAAALMLVEAARLFETSLPKWAGRMLPLVVDLSSAEDSAEVSAAIARAAAPLGSWKLKRQKALVSVTALVGAGVGLERPRRDTAESGQAFQGGMAAGLMAPIGLHFSRPADRWTVGLLASVLDLGQITWSRLDTETRSATEAGTEVAPNTSLSSVFSPGLYLVFGAGHTPFTFGLGASWAPELRPYTIEVGGAERETNVSVWRFGAFAAIDVTLFPF